MRGNPICGSHPEAPARSIPAHAGKPTAECYGGRATWVYPRPCGETTRAGKRLQNNEGLSPPMRGNLSHEPTAVPGHGLSPPMRGNPQRGRRGIGVQGSIPAHAGKPYGKSGSDKGYRVYPRPCGETGPMPNSFFRASGLSPPMRGNLNRRWRCQPVKGSIPAHAGKPRACGLRS